MARNRSQAGAQAAAEAHNSLARTVKPGLYAVPVFFLAIALITDLSILLCLVIAMIVGLVIVGAAHLRRT